MKKISNLVYNHQGLIFLIVFLSLLYYQFIFLGKVPFPGDLLVSSYSPWFDYYHLPVKNPEISDVFSETYLWKKITIESFQNWQWPLWNPYSFTGNPLLANYQSGALYPLNLLLFLPKSLGWELFIFSQTLLAAISMYLLLSRLVRSKLACFGGAIIFSLSGLMTTWLELGTFVHAMAWLPLSLLAIELLFTRFRLRFLLMLIFSLVMILLAGHHQVALFSLGFMIVFSLFRFFISQEKQPLKLLAVFCALIVGLLITSIQLMPTFDLYQKSIRVDSTYILENNYGLLPAKEFFRLFIADIYGNPVTGNYFGSFNYTETSGFIGTFTLAFLIYAFFKLRNNPWVIFFFSISCLILMFSFDNPLSKLLFRAQIPFLTSSYASRALVLLSLNVAILCAFAIDHLKSNFTIKEINKYLIYSFAALAGIAIGMFLNLEFTKYLLDHDRTEIFQQEYRTSRAYQIENYSVTFRNFVWPVFLFSLIFLANIFLKFATRIEMKKVIGSKVTAFFIQNQKVIIIGVLLILLTVDLGRYFLKMTPFVSENLIFPSTPTLAFLQSQPPYFRVGREHGEVLPPNTWTYYGLSSIEGYDPLYFAEYGKFIYLLNTGKINETTKSGRYAELSRYNSPFLNVANAKYFIGVLRDDQGHLSGDNVYDFFNQAGFKRIFKDRNSIVLENPKALDRAFFAKSIVVASPLQAYQLANDSKFDPQKVTILDQDLGIAQTLGEGTVNITSYSSNLVRLKTNTKSDEVLVLSDQYDEGWRAKLDNQSTLISRASLVFRAIKIPAGEHQVEFYYWPQSFILGLKISAITLLIVGLAVLLAIRLKYF